MTNRFLIGLIILISTFIGCKNNNEKKEVLNQETDKSNYYLSDRIEIEFNNDTIFQNDFIKGLISLKKSKFRNKNSKIIVAIEDSLDILKPDLSNESETVLSIFQNLEYDSINRKFFQDYNLRKTATFGKKFKNVGSHKLRGYVMEYYEIDLGPDYDLTSDSLSNQRNKIYFEKEITVLPE